MAASLGENTVIYRVDGNGIYLTLPSYLAYYERDVNVVLGISHDISLGMVPPGRVLMCSLYVDDSIYPSIPLHIMSYRTSPRGKLLRPIMKPLLFISKSGIEPLATARPLSLSVIRHMVHNIRLPETVVLGVVWEELDPVGSVRSMLDRLEEGSVCSEGLTVATRLLRIPSQTIYERLKYLLKVKPDLMSMMATLKGMHSGLINTNLQGFKYVDQNAYLVAGMVEGNETVELWAAQLPGGWLYRGLSLAISARRSLVRIPQETALLAYLLLPSTVSDSDPENEALLSFVLAQWIRENVAGAGKRTPYQTLRLLLAILDSDDATLERSDRLFFPKMMPIPMLKSSRYTNEEIERLESIIQATKALQSLHSQD